MPVSPGTGVTVVRGEHPGFGTDPGADLGIPHIRGTVVRAPYDSHVRMQYQGS